MRSDAIAIEPGCNTASVSDPADNPLAKRIAYFRRHFARGRGRKSTSLQSAKTLHAAALTARCELAALDPNTTPGDLEHLERCARRAREEMERAYQSTPKTSGRRLAGYLARAASA
jgi:hypothetical protein